VLVINGSPQHRLEVAPAGRGSERSSVRATSKDRIRPAPVIIADGGHQAEIKRRHMVGLIGVREPLDGGVPASRGHRDSKMIKRRSVFDGDAHGECRPKGPI
jgi:hypothetical protein